MLDFVNDAIVTLDAFVDAYQSAALLFCTSFETRCASTHPTQYLFTVPLIGNDAYLPLNLQLWS